MTVTGGKDGNPDVYDTLEQGSTLEEFKELDEVRTIIASLSNIYGDQIAVEMAIERFLCKYIDPDMTHYFMNKGYIWCG